MPEPEVLCQGNSNTCNAGEGRSADAARPKSIDNRRPRPPRLKWQRAEDRPTDKCIHRTVDNQSCHERCGNLLVSARIPDTRDAPANAFETQLSPPDMPLPSLRPARAR